VGRHGGRDTCAAFDDVVRNVGGVACSSFVAGR